MGELIEKPFDKQPFDQRTLRFVLPGGILSLIEDGYTTTLDVKVYDMANVDQSASMLLGVPTVTNGSIYAVITGGTDLADYYARIRLTLSKAPFQDEKEEWDLLIQVRQKGK